MDSVKRILWTQRGVESLESIVDFIADDSEYYASRFVKTMLHSNETLKTFPLRGRIVPEFNHPSIRELIYQNYRIVYKIDEQIIYILLVSHGMQSLPNTIHTE